MERKKLFSPAKAKEELSLCLLQRSPGFMSIGFVHGKEAFQASFREMQENNIPDTERQMVVLNYLLGEMQSKVKKFPAAISIQHCDVLDSAKLALLLHKDLLFLDLRFCSKIKNSDIEIIQKTCLHLKELNLSGCSGITSLSQGLVFSSELFFPFLEVLHIDLCPNLKTIYLTGCKLKVVIGKNNSLLQSVKIQAPYSLKHTFQRPGSSIDVMTITTFEWFNISEVPNEHRNNKEFFLEAL